MHTIQEEVKSVMWGFHHFFVSLQWCAEGTAESLVSTFRTDRDALDSCCAQRYWEHADKLAYTVSSLCSASNWDWWRWRKGAWSTVCVHLHICVRMTVDQRVSIKRKSVDEDLLSQKKALLPLLLLCSLFPHCSYCYGNQSSLLGLCMHPMRVRPL